MSFVWWIGLPEVIVRPIFIAFWHTGRRLQIRRLTSMGFFAIYSSAWTIFVLRQLEYMTPNCYEPYPSLSLVVLVLIVAVTLPAAFLASCVVAFLLICCPCLTFLVIKLIRDEKKKFMNKE